MVVAIIFQDVEFDRGEEVRCVGWIAARRRVPVRTKVLEVVLLSGRTARAAGRKVTRPATDGMNAIRREDMLDRVRD